MIRQICIDNGAGNESACVLKENLMQSRSHTWLKDILMSQNQSGLTFLHLSLCRFQNKTLSPEIYRDFVKLQMLLAPECTLIEDNLNRFPLHRAAQFCVNDPEVIYFLIDAYPKAAGKPDLYGQLPLHLAAANAENGFAVRLLLDAYPQGLYVEDNYAMLPIDYAITRNKCNIFLDYFKFDDKLVSQFVQKAMELGYGNRSLSLMQKYPRSYNIRSSTGAMAVHYAARYCNKSIIEFFIHHRPLDMKRADDIGRSPLFYAILNERDHEVMRSLIVFDKDLVCCEDKKKILPIHVCASLKTGKSYLYCKYLLEISSKVATIMNGNGKLPSYYALMHGNIDSFHLLLEHYPLSILHLME
mmetsp:Transcript_4563/g.6140  ORF Transcript_4563/g.6140 Transcript_4563/m.6140 type:complete len:357 (+) Transcript_4563:363-1433(+)